MEWLVIFLEIISLFKLLLFFTNSQISHSVWPIAYCPEHGGFTSADPNAEKYYFLYLSLKFSFVSNFVSIFRKYKISTKEGNFSQIFT